MLNIAMDRLFIRTFFQTWLIGLFLLGCQSSPPNSLGPTPVSSPSVALPRFQSPERDDLRIPDQQEPSAVKPSPKEKGSAPEVEQASAHEKDMLRELYQRAVDKEKTIDNYVARFRRREVVGGKQQPEDILLSRYRRAPFSIYFKWMPGTAYQGREVLYVHGQFNNKIQTKTGKGDLIAGLRVAVDPNSRKATQGSRRTIVEAGMGNMVARFGRVLVAQYNNDTRKGTLRHIGLYRRPEFPYPLETVVQDIPAGSEQHLPRGGQRFWFFNTEESAAEYGLPVLIITMDTAQREVEYYCHDKMEINVCSPQHFDPKSLWGR